MMLGLTPESTFSYEVKVNPGDKIDFLFRLSPEKARDLADHVRDALTGKEVLLRLPPQVTGSWMIYWKVREADSRTLFAHPEKEEWVATIGLEQAVFERVLQKLHAGESFRLDSLCMLTGFSNLAVEFQVS